MRSKLDIKLISAIKWCHEFHYQTKGVYKYIMVCNCGGTLKSSKKIHTEDCLPIEQIAVFQESKKKNLIIKISENTQ